MSDWQAIHILPEGMVLAVHLFTPGQNTRISLMESLWRRSTGDMRGFSSRYLPHSCMKNTFGPTSEKTTLCKVVCFVRVRLLLRHGNPSERQVIWLCRGRLCTRWQPCSVTDFLCVWASTHAEEKQKKKRPVCVLYSSVSLVKLQLGVIYSESGGKLTLRLQRRLKYPALLSHYIVLLHLSTRSHTASYPLWSGERGIKRWQGQGFTSHT